MGHPQGGTLPICVSGIADCVVPGIRGQLSVKGRDSQRKNGEDEDEQNPAHHGKMTRKNTAAVIQTTVLWPQVTTFYRHGCLELKKSSVLGSRFSVIDARFS